MGVLTTLSSSRPGHWSMRFRAPFTGGPGSVAGLPVPRRLVVALDPRFGLAFLPLGASVSFCNMHSGCEQLHKHKRSPQVHNTRSSQALHEFRSVTEGLLASHPGRWLLLHAFRTSSLLLGSQTATYLHCLERTKQLRSTE